ncbi:RpoS-dependent hydroperoxidase II [Klebsiella pneumoniae]|uniref:RpoS-dependent hydroperoxidase II n=1 Tax=Klebsiella pneumoniae TaxID=573 RepID=A0A377TQG9_KLEPN|nr:RpoS-dependent hydroperoxidase II [Klebsiella pneumoniae]
MAPHAETYRSGRRTTAPGSLKAPDTHNSKLDSLEAQRKGGEDFPLTTNQGVRIADDQEFAARR